ncbi:hypothetical protein F9C07_2286512 [Aspergillus flavus]|uniref:Uncharacterized protein n=1 Tax=Aspergillus flavus (strain ATCC 200026 / FGSC A1120 / IAM 13836 / NRRL 3357 / JCM 12722 / SRRC 167) TaxID=332952 RepID=A0A7U2N2Y6_ASPFN|nr:uncharacterized protein G4B84_009341 [Aspergillus flavus NRRL3357]KAF7623079.1 hypothetical protein AFLA_010389 [Aspergillus flavus NRRL3357]QMW33875.1 hypothetical protein G4B84_009341 [Aspergillus flavus NRRL3357]QRD94410.1 hypothetical protein F9C07_2286512 [Aspergillus flavus]
MHPTIILQNAARAPRIRALGQHFVTRSAGQPSRLPSMSSTRSSYDSFAAYRSRAYQHGPLHQASFMRALANSRSGAYEKALNSRGEYIDHGDLSSQTHHLPWTEAEIDAIESGGASLLS